MNPFVTLAFLSLSSLCLLSTSQAATPEHQSKLFEKTRLVYADDFDSSELNTGFWEVRQNSTWKIANGILTGSESPKEFQEKKIAEGDRGHAGFKPVIWLKQVPENFVVTMRLRYAGKDYMKGFPLLDLGHHIHTLTFSEKATTLAIQKKVETFAAEEPLFSINEWHDVVIELKKGTILLLIDGRKHLFESTRIDMTGHAQIDFKGIDFGTCQIDHIRVWEGL